jgi:hypothetical protein
MVDRVGKNSGTVPMPNLPDTTLNLQLDERYWRRLMELEGKKETVTNLKEEKERMQISGADSPGIRSNYNPIIVGGHTDWFWVRLESNLALCT